MWPQATGGAQAPDQSPITIQSIQFDGNHRIRTETLQGRIFTRGGDPYSAAGLQRDFQALWNTQYFEDIRLEVQDSPTNPNAKIVIFHVVERPTIRRIRYVGNKSITESDILDAFKDRKVGLSVESPFDPTKIKKAQVVIQELEALHGHQFAVVKATYEKVPATSGVVLIFTVDEGPKVKVGRITFQGNTVFSNRKLIRSMHDSRPYAIPMWLFEVPVLPKTFDRAQLDEDLEAGIRALYQNNGYFNVVVGDPILKTVDIHKRGLPGPIPWISRDRGKATDITIPIEEGDQYRMGKLVIRSVDPDKGLSFKVDFLYRLFPMKKGDIFNADTVHKAIENYTKLYGEVGYIDFTAVPSAEADKATKTVNLIFDFDEQKQFFVRRIDFSGNTTTRDKVIRRELLINEGDIFNNRYWEISLLRLNQLGYFNRIMPEDAQLTRNTQQGTVDILLKLKESGKQSISLTGGVSGLSGSFVSLGYQTKNFLGLGETLGLSGQIGTLQRSAQFSFTEPYLFDRPISTGFTIFTTRYKFDQSEQESVLLGQKVQINPNLEQDYNTNTTGGTIFASYPLRKFSFARLGLTYGYSNTDITSFSTSSTDLFELLQFQSLAGPSALEGIHSSSLTPSLTYNTVGDIPTFPTHGKSFFYSVNLQGGPLGGNVRAITNIVEMKYFRPVTHKRNVLAFRFTAEFASGYAGRELPPFQRLFLGGEQDLRGFDIRTVTPIAFIPISTSTTVSYTDPTSLSIFGTPQAHTVTVPLQSYQISFPGGDTSGVLNAEYRIPIVGHTVSVSLFSDTGTVGILRKDQLEINATGLANIAQQFSGIQLNQTLGIQPGTNFKLRASAGVELVVQLPIIGAPVRLYWANNFERISQQIVAPPSSFQSTSLQNIELAAGQRIFDTQILPQLNSAAVNPQRINFFESLSTFRFTISRTF